MSYVGLMALSQSLKVYFDRMAVLISLAMVCNEVKSTAGFAQSNSLSMSTEILCAALSASCNLVRLTSFLKLAGFWRSKCFGAMSFDTSSTFHKVALLISDAVSSALAPGVLAHVKSWRSVFGDL